MKRLIMAVTLVWVLMFVPLGAVFGAYEDLFDSTRAASWAIYMRTQGGMSATCSAEAVKSTEKVTYLISAAHCFLGERTNKTDFLATQDHKTFYNANLYKSGLVLKSGMKATSTDLNDFEGNDWAVVTVNVENKPIMPIGDSAKMRLGEDILIVGLPFGLDFLAVQGIIGSKDISLSTFIWNHYYGGNIYIAGGNSGSGVISTKQKAVIGIVCAGPGSQTSMLIFMPINLLPKDILQFLKAE